MSTTNNRPDEFKSSLKIVTDKVHHCINRLHIKKNRTLSTSEDKNLSFIKKSFNELSSLFKNTFSKTSYFLKKSKDRKFLN